MFPSDLSNHWSALLQNNHAPVKKLLGYCSTICILFVNLSLQLPEALQGDENQGPAFVVQADPQRSPLPAHKSPAHYSQRPQM